MYASEFQLNSFRGRKFFAELLYKWGTLYDGKVNTAAALIGVNINKHLNLTEQFEYNQLNINSKPDNIQQLISSINYAFTTKLDFSLLGQYNSQEDQLLTNFRVHWIPEIGSDFYFVFNNGYDPVKRADYLRPTIKRCGKDCLALYLLKGCVFPVHLQHKPIWFVIYKRQSLNY